MGDTIRPGTGVFPTVVTADTQTVYGVSKSTGYTLWSYSVGSAITLLNTVAKVNDENVAFMVSSNNPPSFTTLTIPAAHTKAWDGRGERACVCASVD